MALFVCVIVCDMFVSLFTGWLSGACLFHWMVVWCLSVSVSVGEVVTRLVVVVFMLLLPLLFGVFFTRRHYHHHHHHHHYHYHQQQQQD